MLLLATRNSSNSAMETTNLLDLPDDVIDRIYGNLNLRALLSLNMTCRYLSDVSSTFLFRNIYFYDPDRESHLLTQETEFSFKYMLIPVSKMTEFTEFMRRNAHLAQQISSIVFHTDLDQQTKDLLFFLLEHKQAGGSPRHILFKGHDVRLLSYLSDNSGDVTAQVASRLYENDEVYDRPGSQDGSATTLFHHLTADAMFGPLVDKKLPVVSTQLLSPLDADRVIQLKLALSEVEIRFPHAYPESFLSKCLIHHWSSSLKSLTLANYASCLYFTKGLKNYSKSVECYSAKLFSNLETLSVCFTDDILNNDELQTVLQLLNLGSIVNLEIKYKRTLFNNSTAANLELIDYLNKNINFRALKQFSLVNLNSNNMLANNIYQHEISESTNLCYAIMDHFNLFSSNADTLTSLNICLNTFPVIPRVSRVCRDDPAVFFADPKYIARKAELLDRILRLYNLEILVIPDFLFNWWPFLENDTMPFFEHGMGHSHHSANRLIPILHRRFDSFENGSGLNIIDYPPLRYGFNFNVTLNDYLNRLVPVISGFAQRLPHLRFLNLGGVLLEIHRDGQGTVEKINGVYDSWVFTDFPMRE